ncbi:MAG: AAA family ATPase [Saprospiraceae bacterium]|nr:AAA family ATPase [Saprospiraceae bacterium]
MWVEELMLDNIKCFDKQSIRLGSSNTPYPWITLLGENGTGKSTVLQAIALMLAGPEGAAQLLKPVGWLKDGTKPGKMTIRLHQGHNDPGKYAGEKKERRVFQYTFYVTGEQKQSINKQVFTEPVITADSNSRTIPWLRENVLFPKGKGWFGAGYGAFRRLTRKSRIIVPTLQQPLRYTNFSSQFNEDESLEAFETWLVYLDYRISKSDDELAKKQMDWGIKAINQLLPEGNSFDSIDSNGRIWFKTGESKAITISLSDGFRSVMALAGDLVWRMIESFPESQNPLLEEGVVLIDELDIHLHPTWQRQIAGLLRQTFPKVQFIMATHSPLVAAGAGENAVSYRFYKKDGNVEVQQIKNIYAMSVDKILQSDAFGLVSAFSPETQSKIDEYYALKKKTKLTKTERMALEAAIPFVEQALGYESEVSETENAINEFIKKNWK